MKSLLGRHIRLGRSGEGLAADYFKDRGYRVLDTNFRTRFGELDLVLEDGGEIVFVEVKTRRGHGFGRPEEAVTPEKQERIRRCAESWLQRNGLLEDLPQIRFDVLAITLDGAGLDGAGKPPSIRHIANAF